MLQSEYFDSKYLHFSVKFSRSLDLNKKSSKAMSATQ